MQEYANKIELMHEIEKTFHLFIREFADVTEAQQNLIVEGVDRTPAQMIAYQLGWMGLLLSWEKCEKNGQTVVTPAPGYKWNQLGGLYQSFYETYQEDSIRDLEQHFADKVKEILDWIQTLPENVLFQQSQRQWASSTPSNWPVWKWIHINTVAPFQSFRTKIRKWKKQNTTIC